MIGMLKMKKDNIQLIGLFLLFSFSNSTVIAQLKNHSFSFFYHENDTKTPHSSIKPYLESYQFSTDTAIVERDKKWKKKLFDESLLYINEHQIRLTTDPLFNFTLGPQNAVKDFFYSSNVRGFRITGDVTSKLSFETRFYENQFFYPDYLAQKAIQRAEEENSIDAVAFGLGRAKKFKDYGVDAGLGNGYISFSPIRNMNFQLGHGRHFFGNGYRSLVLSDYSPDYPYLSGQYYLIENKLLYKHVQARLYNLNRIPISTTPESMLIPKSFSFNQLSLQATPELSFSIFEGATFKTYSSDSGTVRPHYSFYIPIMGTNLLAIDSVNSNTLIFGFNTSYSLKDRIKLYNQFVIRDEQRIGAQIGMRWNFSVDRKQSNSFINLEFNYSPTALYSVDSINKYQQFSHLSHELAHPLGSGFNEWLIKGQINYKRFFCRFSDNIVKIDQPGNNQHFANQVFTPVDLISSVDETSRLIFLNNSIGVLINTSTKMEFSIGHLSRAVDGNWDNYILFSWRTYLKNDYFDQ